MLVIERPEGGAVVGGLASDDLHSVGFALGEEVLAGEFPCGFDCLGAAGREEHSVHVARGEFSQFRCQRRSRWMSHAPDREVRHRLGLLACCVREVGTPVTDLGDEQTREGVEVLLAVGVPQVAAIAPFDDDWSFGRHGCEVEPQVVHGGFLDVDHVDPPAG